MHTIPGSRIVISDNLGCSLPLQFAYPKSQLRHQVLGTLDGSRGFLGHEERFGRLPDEAISLFEGHAEERVIAVSV